jgi:hypothetical protein
MGTLKSLNYYFGLHTLFMASGPSPDCHGFLLDDYSVSGLDSRCFAGGIFLLDDLTLSLPLFSKWLQTR